MDIVGVIGIIIVAVGMIYATYDSHFERKEKSTVQNVEEEQQ